MHKNSKNQPKRILFLCTGNYYRSRFAEIFFNSQARSRGLSWTAESRGLALCGTNYGPISSYTISRLSEHGIESDDCQRFPIQVSETDLASADHIVAVKEAEHRPLLEARFPNWRDRVEYWHVHDLDCATADDAIPQLEKQVLNLLERLAA
jgi:protein-tyrosine phosphatase